MKSTHALGIGLAMIVSASFFHESMLQAATLKVPADQKTIQGAIDQAQPGDTIIVSPGTYKERIKLKPGIAIKSAGDDTAGKLGLKRAEATIIDGGGVLDGEAGKAPGVEMAEHAILDGFTITNVGLYDDAKWKKHHATQGEHQEHERIGTFGTTGIAITTPCRAVNNIVHHIGNTGIAIHGKKALGPVVANNVTYRNMGGGIGAMAGSTAIITGNKCFQNFYAGIGHSNAHPMVLNNECYENIRAGIGISEGACPVVRGNKCYKNRRAGIGVRTTGKTRPVIEDNECYENDMAGIGAREEAQPVIRNNKCYRNALAGIGSRTEARPLIIDNETYENKAAGIGTRAGAHAIIIGNHSHHNASAGIGVRTKGTHALLIGNQCIDNKLVAIGIPDGASALIHGNTLSRKGGMPPLIAVRGGSSAVFTDNTISGGGVAGVLLQGTALLVGNRFTVGGGSGVWLWEGSKAAIVQNTFQGYRTGVNSSGSTVQVVGNHISGFQGTAIQINKSKSPPVIVGNRAVLTKGTDKAVKTSDEKAVNVDNVLVPAKQEK
jgi:hypothetical protein